MDELMEEFTLVISDETWLNTPLPATGFVEVSVTAPSTGTSMTSLPSVFDMDAPWEATIEVTSEPAAVIVVPPVAVPPIVIESPVSFAVSVTPLPATSVRVSSFASATTLVDAPLPETTFTVLNANWLTSAPDAIPSSFVTIAEPIRPSDVVVATP